MNYSLIPDLLFSLNEGGHIFASADNIVYVIANAHGESLVVFERRASLPISTSIVELDLVLKSKGFINCCDRVLIRMDKVLKIETEDFGFNLIMKNKKKVSLTGSEAALIFEATSEF